MSGEFFSPAVMKVGDMEWPLSKSAIKSDLGSRPRVGGWFCLAALENLAIALPESRCMVIVESRKKRSCLLSGGRTRRKREPRRDVG